MFTAVLFTVAKTWNQPKCPSTDEWIKNLWYTSHIHTTEYYSTIKMEAIMPFVTTWMKLEGFMPSEKSEKDKYYRSFINVESKRKRKKQTQRKKVEICVYQR